MSAATSTSRVDVGVRDLKNHLSGYLDRVKAGEEITITQHGRPIARLTSVSPDVVSRTALIEAGIIRPAPVERRQLPAKRVKLAPGETISDLIAQQRG
jgi:prevent-host-death family protein